MKAIIHADWSFTKETNKQIQMPLQFSVSFLMPVCKIESSNVSNCFFFEQVKQFTANAQKKFNIK
jgi:hypothetical protein